MTEEDDRGMNISDPLTKIVSARSGSRLISRPKSREYSNVPKIALNKDLPENYHFTNKTTLNFENRAKSLLTV